jgi:hypothetical protein
MTEQRNRPLTDAERGLVRWMLERGTADAKQYLDQLALAEVTPWRCPCGCATIHFQIRGYAEPPPGIDTLGNFVTREGDHQTGAFIYSSGGLLRGIEVYGLTGDAPHVLPRPEELRDLESARPG